MSKVVINGKFKEDFFYWLKSFQSSYGDKSKEIEFWHYAMQIDYIMKFINSKPFDKPYTEKEHNVYTTEKVNVIIENYNLSHQ